MDTWIALFEKKGRATFLADKQYSQQDHTEKGEMETFWSLLLAMLAVAAAQGALNFCV